MENSRVARARQNDGGGAANTWAKVGIAKLCAQAATSMTSRWASYRDVASDTDWRFATRWRTHVQKADEGYTNTLDTSLKAI